MNEGERRISRFEELQRDAFLAEAEEKGLTPQEVFTQFMNTEVYGPGKTLLQSSQMNFLLFQNQEIILTKMEMT